mgnify:CR=1 FL=1
MSSAAYEIAKLDLTGDVLRVVQLTDTHLCARDGGTLLGMDTDHSLQAVIELVRGERPELDLVLGTGDLADGGAREAYERLRDYFDGLCMANFWLPGNHDDHDAMLSVTAGAPRLYREIRAGQWQIVLLNSQVPGEVGGELGAEELAFLEAALAEGAKAGLHALVSLHHQPVTVGCGWLDEQMVSDASALCQLLDRYDGVRALLWGHVHQEIDRDRNGVRLLASPSPCVQFAPGCDKFQADDLPPG